MLLGVAHYTKFVLKNRANCVFLTDSLVATDTNFGWMVQGQETLEQGNSLSAYVTIQTKFNCGCEDLKKLFHDPLVSTEEKDLVTEEWIQQYMNRMVYDSEAKRWVVPLPWRSPHLRPPNNRHVAYRLAEQQVIKLEQRGQRQQCDEAMQAYVSKSQMFGCTLELGPRPNHL